MTYFNFPHIEEDDNLKNLRNDVKSFLKTTFNSNNIKPQADAWMYSANPEFSKKLGEKGWLGMSFPKKYGGREKTMLERYVITEELLVAGAPVAAHWIADRQSGSQIIRYGTEEQKKDIKRYWIPLEDWHWGHFIQVGNSVLTHWKAGEIYTWNYGMYHLGANAGIKTRWSCQVTGYSTEESLHNLNEFEFKLRG